MAAQPPGSGNDSDSHSGDNGDKVEKKKKDKKLPKRRNRYPKRSTR